MTTLKQGDLIKDRNGIARKVIEMCGTVLHISQMDNLTKYCFTADEAGLIEFGYTWDTSAWEPKRLDVYWHIDGQRYIGSSIWLGDTDDHNRRDFLGIYETKKLAAAALLEIRRKLGK